MPIADVTTRIIPAVLVITAGTGFVALAVTDEVATVPYLFTGVLCIASGVALLATPAL